MNEIVCIVCPNSCVLRIDGEGENLTVSGNKCKRGETFAKAEMTNPVRTICTTARTSFKDAPVVPVRVSKDIPKDKIFDIMREIDKVTVSKPVKRGDVLIADVLGTGADIIVTSDLLTLIDKENENE